MAFAHGSNDVANAIGPLAAVNAVSKAGVGISKSIDAYLAFIDWSGRYRVWFGDLRPSGD